MLKKIVFLSALCMSMYGIESDGFRDIKWGSSPDALGKNINISHEDKPTKQKMITKNDDKLSISTAKLESINYRYFDEKLMGVLIIFKGYESFAVIKNAFEEKYGSPYKPNRYMEDYMWNNGNAMLEIQYSNRSNQGTALFVNKKIHDEEKAFATQLARGASKDF